jgi:hypothetical protein
VRSTLVFRGWADAAPRPVRVTLSSPAACARPGCARRTCARPCCTCTTRACASAKSTCGKLGAGRGPRELPRGFARVLTLPTPLPAPCAQVQPAAAVDGL